MPRAVKQKQDSGREERFPAESCFLYFLSPRLRPRSGRQAGPGKKKARPHSGQALMLKIPSGFRNLFPALSAAVASGRLEQEAPPSPVALIASGYNESGRPCR